MDEAIYRWSKPKRPFSKSWQQSLRKFVLFIAIAYFALELGADFFFAFKTNKLQQETDLALVHVPGKKIWMRRVVWQSISATPGSPGSSEVVLEGLPSHCNRGTEVIRQTGPEVRDWCSKVLVDINAVTKTMKPCKARPTLADLCSEGWVEVKIKGDRISFGPASGTYGEVVLFFRILIAKVRVLILWPFALGLAVLPLGLLDFVYGREEMDWLDDLDEAEDGEQLKS